MGGKDGWETLGKRVLQSMRVALRNKYKRKLMHKLDYWQTIKKLLLAVSLDSIGRLVQAY